MKNKLYLVIIVVMIAMVLPIPAYAYSGVEGDVLDSFTLQPWTHGGEVFVLNLNTGALIATCALLIADAPPLEVGDFQCIYGTDGLGTGATLGPPPANSDQVRVIIDYTCPVIPANCTGFADPPANTEYTFTELSFLTSNANTGSLQTGTGPNAIELVDFSVTTQSSSNTWLPFFLLIGSVALVSGAIILIRKRKA